jgi:5'-methylthioadenosine phosphorylase
VINMTQYPEFWLAREVELCYAGIALVTDYDVGLEGMPPVTTEVALAAFEENLHRLRDLLFRAIPRIGPQPEDACATALRSAIVR